MPQIQINLQTIPAVVVLNSDTNEIAFKKTHPNSLVDRQQDIPEATWGSNKLFLDGKEYTYQQWYKVDEGSVFKKYFKKVISEGYSPFNHAFTI